MKRVFLILSIFAILFSCLCVLGCGSEESSCGLDSIFVEKYEKESGTCSSLISVGMEELTGCHVVNKCVDCYWIPTACGYYENDLKLVSCVTCGFDCTFGECYGDHSFSSTERKEIVPNMETRTPVPAIRGVDYTVDSIKCTIYYGELKSLVDSELDLEDLESMIGLISMWGEETQIQVVVEYTALKELNRVSYEGDLIYDGYEWTNYTNRFYKTAGNGEWDEPVKSMNIAPGKHYLYLTIGLNFYEMTSLKGFSQVAFKAYTYAEE